jgi:hypothetical protein
MPNDRPRHGAPLAVLVETSSSLHQIRKDDLHCGDLMLVKTRNSMYTIQMLDQGVCMVTGGWFDRKGVSPMRTRIAGCTWGGSAIKVDVVAVCGLRLEFANRLVTTEIRTVALFSRGSLN